LLRGTHSFLDEGRKKKMKPKVERKVGRRTGRVGIKYFLQSLEGSKLDHECGKKVGKNLKQARKIIIAEVSVIQDNSEESCPHVDYPGVNMD